MSLNNIQSGSLSNIQGGSLSNINGGSLSNIGGGSLNKDESKDNEIKFEGNLLENIRKDFKTIGADVTTLAGAIFGWDPEARQALGQTLRTIANDPREFKILADAMLSTYNLTVDELGEMPLGEVVGNVLTGIWEHPVQASLDILPVLSGAYKMLPKSFTSKLAKLDEGAVRVELAEKVTRDNVKLTQLGNEFVRKIDKIEQKYNPKSISKAMKQIEEVGLANISRKSSGIIHDLLDANDTYKQFVGTYGAKIYDDYDFATLELMSKRSKIPFSEFDTPEFRQTKTYQDALEYVKQNDIKPLFHLKPEVYTNFDDIERGTKIESELLSRKYGTIDYSKAPENFSNKAAEFVNRVVQSKTLDSAESLNKYIDDYNIKTGSKVKKVNPSSFFSNNRMLNEINRELKKTMLSSGTYLGANILTTTLSILNNFDLNAASKTLKNLPKFRMVELTEAKTPVLNLISRLNNKFYKPIASVDKYLENIASEYIANHPNKDIIKYMQSTIPSKVVTTNEVEAAVKSLVPFGSYPMAAFKELVATIKGRPGRTAFYNQVAKVGEELNRQAQENVQGLREPDTSEVIRPNKEGELIRRSTVITPIQAANMFLLGEYGDAIQIPIYTFLNNLISGKGDPNVINIDGKSYRVENGEIKTNKGSFNLLPSLAYIGRQMLGPVQFYNQVIVPLMSDKYVRDETRVFNRLVNDAQYSNMSKRAQWKVQDNAKEKLGKRILGTYEYNYWEDRIYPRTRRRIMNELGARRSLNRALSSDNNND